MYALDAADFEHRRKRFAMTIVVAAGHTEPTAERDFEGKSYSAFAPCRGKVRSSW